MDATTDLVSSAAAPAIFNLHEDLLLHIFHLNTYTPETEYSYDGPYTSFDSPSPLTIARHTSQVCHTWRQTILCSPAIWGSLIDMTIFETSTKFWAEEVLGRTGNSDLSIYGCVGPGSVQIFTFLLKNDWHRVRRLDILLNTWGFGRIADVFHGQPAPRLEKFLFRCTYHRFIQNDRWTTLFADSAPSLRRYHNSFLAHEYRETWISRLSSLTLSDSLPLSTSDIFRILETTVHLESLIIEDPEISSSGTDWNRIYLPKLVRLHISGTVFQCLLFLQNIVGHPNCVLVLRVNDQEEDLSADEFDLLLKITGDYTARYINIHRPSRLMIYMGSLTLEIQTVKYTDMMYFAHPQIHLTFAYRFLERMLLYAERVMSALSSLSLGCILELEFNSDEFSWVSPDPEAFWGLSSLMKSLSSVQTLIVTPYFKLLDIVIRNSASLLPLLKVLQLKYKKPINTGGSSSLVNFSQDMHSFFSQRKVAGMPVLKLDIGDGVVGCTNRYDWRFLDDIEGLKVVWRRNSEEFEYICGSGEKDRLNWS